MSYDEEQQKRSRVVIETPTARREVVEEKTVRYPPPGYPPERRGYSTGVVATVALLAIAATALIFLFLTNSRDDSTEVNINARAAAQPTPFAQPPVTVQTPMTQPTPIIIQQVPQTVPAPVIIQAPPTTTDPATTAPPPATTTAPPAAPAASDDATLQTKIDKSFADDAAVSAASVNATVVNGRVLLSGTVNSDAVKQRAERLAYAVKGVLGVDNKIIVTANTPLFPSSIPFRVLVQPLVYFGVGRVAVEFIAEAACGDLALVARGVRERVAARCFVGALTLGRAALRF